MLNYAFFFLSEQPTVTERALAAERLAPVSHTHSSTSVAPKEVYQTAKARLHKDMREELLDNKKGIFQCIL